MNPALPETPVAPPQVTAQSKPRYYREYLIITFFVLFLGYLVWLRTDDYPWYEVAANDTTYILGIEVNPFRLLLVLPCLIYTCFVYWKLLKHYKQLTIGLIVWSVAFFFIPLISPTIFLLYSFVRKQIAPPPSKIANDYAYVPIGTLALKEASPKTAARGITVLVLTAIIIFYLSIFLWGLST